MVYLERYTVVKYFIKKLPSKGSEKKNYTKSCYKKIYQKCAIFMTNCAENCLLLDNQEKVGLERKIGA